MKKVAFIGSAGSGKSTLTAEVFVRLKQQGFYVENIHEFIRYDIQRNGPMQSIWEQYRTLHHQRALEDSVPETVDWMLTDSGCLTPYFYSCLYASKANERERLVLADMFKFLIDDIYKKRYEYVFFLPAAEIYEKNKDEVINDGTRYQSAEELSTLDQHMRLMFTEVFQMDNIINLVCPLAERADKVLEILLK